MMKNESGDDDTIVCEGKPTKNINTISHIVS